MTTTTSTQQQCNETEHYQAAEKWLQKAEDRYATATEDFTLDADDVQAIDFYLRFAAVHAQLSVAADHDRLADCVPDGGSRFQVAGTR